MAVDTLVNITQDEIEYARMTSLIIGELDWNTGMAEARSEGLAEGIEKGKAEGMMKGRVETARNLKLLGVSMDVIIKSTGLPQEEIAQL